MDILISFLLRNYIYFIFGAILLILALIGYIVDKGQTNKRKREEIKRENETVNVPVTPLNTNIQLGVTPPPVNNQKATFIDTNNNMPM